MTTNNKGIKSLWGYPLIDIKGRHAIDDVRSNLENNFQKKNDDTLTTTNKSIVGGINEVVAQYKDIAKQTITAEERNKLTSLENYDDSEIKTSINNKADKTTTDNIQTQVNNLVLGAVGDGNNAEVVQARDRFDTITDRFLWDEKSINSISQEIWESKSTEIENGYMKTDKTITTDTDKFHTTLDVKVGETYWIKSNSG